MKIPAPWKKAFRIGFVVVMFFFIMLLNKHYFNISFKIEFGSAPRESKSPPMALEILTLEDSIYQTLTGLRFDK